MVNECSWNSILLHTCFPYIAQKFLAASYLLSASCTALVFLNEYLDKSSMPCLTKHSAAQYLSFNVTYFAENVAILKVFKSNNAF